MPSDAIEVVPPKTVSNSWLRTVRAVASPERTPAFDDAVLLAVWEWIVDNRLLSWSTRPLTAVVTLDGSCATLTETAEPRVALGSRVRVRPGTTSVKVLLDEVAVMPRPMLI